MGCPVLHDITKVARDWVHQSEFCYLLVNDFGIQPASRDVSKETCRTLGGELASIPTTAYQNGLRKGLAENVIKTDGVWIGLYKTVMTDGKCSVFL